MSVLRRSFLFAALFITPLAFAQSDVLDELGTEVAPKPVKKATPPPVEDPPIEEPPPAKIVTPPVVQQPKVEPKKDVPPPAVKVEQPPAKKVDAKKEPKVVETAPVAAPTERVGPKAVLVSNATNATLEEAWERWRKAMAAMDAKGVEAAEAELRTLKAEIGALSLEQFSVGFSRASAARRAANDAGGAVRLAALGVEMAPDLPYAHIELARAYMLADPSEVGRIAGEVKTSLGLLFTDPRYARPAIADLMAALLAALVATAAAVVLMMFVRKARYFFHDFHHLFPRAAAPWQSAAFALLLLLLPIVFRAGPVPMLLTLFLVVSFYLSLTERLVAAVLLVLVSLVPIFGGLVVENTAFAGTVAEDVYRLERGGIDAESSATRTNARVKDGRATFAETFALARYEYRRGQLDRAIELFKSAAGTRPGNALVLTNLGNAMLARGDEEGALTQYMGAVASDPSLAAGSYNLSRIYYRRAKLLPDLEVGPMLDKAQLALTEAQRLDPVLLTRTDPPEDNLKSNLYVLSPPLPLDEISAIGRSEDLGDAVSRQLAGQLLGATNAQNGLLLGAGLTLLVFALSFARGGLKNSQDCEKCGRAVCRRCDPELGIGSHLCNQCVHVFTRKGAVPPLVKVRKQTEVAQYQTRMDRFGYFFGLLLSGAGHIFRGLTIRGAIYAFLFLFIVMNFFFRSGVLRAPFGSAPELFRLVPLGLGFALIYALTLRGLYKREED